MSHTTTHGKLRGLKESTVLWDEIEYSVMCGAAEFCKA